MFVAVVRESIAQPEDMFFLGSESFQGSHDRVPEEPTILCVIL
jgi:hypothetical protein